MTTDPNLDLLRRWREGDRLAGIVVVREYQPRVAEFFRNTVGHALRRTLVNATFERVMNEKQPIPQNVDVRTCLLKIARRVLVDYLRSLSKDGTFDPKAITLEQAGPSVTVEQITSQPQLQQVASRLHGIPLDMQLIVELRYWQECSMADISAIIELSEGEARGQLHEALGTLSTSPGRYEDSDHGAPATDTNHEALENTLSELRRSLSSSR